MLALLQVGLDNYHCYWSSAEQKGYAGTGYVSIRTVMLSGVCSVMGLGGGGGGGKRKTKAKQNKKYIGSCCSALHKSKLVVFFSVL